jgi:hypothetical protein
LQCLVAKNCKLFFHSGGNGTGAALTLDALATLIDPTIHGFEAVAELIDLADAAVPDSDLEPDADREPDSDLEGWSVPLHLSGGNGDVPTKDQNIETERERVERAERDRKAAEIWAAASAAHYASSCLFAPWTPANQQRAEAGLALRTYLEGER